jgi:methionyl-tRNA formyltransferase
MLKLIFMGTPEFSVPCFNHLISSPDVELLAVVTQPDKPAGRGKKITPSPIKTVALEAGIPVFTPNRLRTDEEVMLALEVLKPDYIVTIAFGQILPLRVLQIPRGGTVNVHASLLPEYRGANPIQWAVLDGKTETGLTTMLSDEGVDTGDMLLKQVIPIEADDTTGQVAEKLAGLAGDLLLRTLNGLEAQTIHPEKQNDALSTLAPKLRKEETLLDASLPALALKQRILGLTPFPNAKLEWKGTVIKLGKVSVKPQSSFLGDVGEKGQVLTIDKSGIWVQTSQDILCIETLQPAGKSMMNAADWGRNAFQSLNPLPIIL